MLATLVGGSLSAASANAFNCYIDRDIDRVMKRTQKRPLVTGELTDREALVFAWVTGVVSIAWLWVFTTWLAAVLSLAAILFYVLVYTLVLKRRTPQNIVWGGAAGCMPVLIGWAAVTGSLTWAPVILFGIVFLWTPPHYWPLSMRYREDYAVGVRCRCSRSCAAARSSGLQVVLYAWATVVCSLLLVPIAPMGILYAVVATAVGRLVPVRGAPPVRAGDPGRRGQADAGVPREHHLPDPGVHRGRARPAAVLPHPVLIVRTPLCDALGWLPSA